MALKRRRMLDDKDLGLCLYPGILFILLAKNISSYFFIPVKSSNKDAIRTRDVVN